MRILNFIFALVLVCQVYFAIKVSKCACMRLFMWKCQVAIFLLLFAWQLQVFRLENYMG